MTCPRCGVPGFVMYGGYCSAECRTIHEFEQDRDTWKARAEKAEWFINAEGYRRCDVPACNCPYWHGGHWQARYDELKASNESLRAQLAEAMDKAFEEAATVVETLAVEVYTDRATHPASALSYAAGDIRALKDKEPSK
jgi:hypothetical protein